MSLLPSIPGLSLAGGMVAGSVLDAVKSAMQDCTTWIVGQVFDLLDRTSEPNLSAAWFKSEAAAMGKVVVLVVVPVLMAATIGPVLRQDARRLFRVWCVGLPVALLAGVLGTQFAGLALTATDQLGDVVAGGSTQSFAHDFSTMFVKETALNAPTFGQMLICGVVILGSLAVWLELLVRSAAVYVAVFFMPLALVAYIWPATAHVAKRVLEILVALILSKFVIVATIALGEAALNQSNAVNGVLSGAAILLVASFAPFTLLRLAPVVEVAAISHLEGLSRRPAQAATMAAASRTHPVTQLIASAHAGARDHLEATPVTAYDIPWAEPSAPWPPPPDWNGGQDA